ncbi:MAG: hypothetical protein LUF87_07210 [Alistipes sp.]|nr:hypothetical protein [Alistipes sp.]
MTEIDKKTAERNREEAKAERRGERKRKWRRLRNISIVIVVLLMGIFFAVRFYYPFGEGVKTGQLNYVVYKGVVFKTYEGKLIQSGFQSDQTGGIQSNQFVFSVAKKDVAEKLMHAGGQIVELHYKEYFGALPWRGYSRYIVDEIINISPASSVGSDLPVVFPQ